jgi:L-lysine 2,3-aminomutase
MSVESQPQPSNVRPSHREASAHAGDQPFAYPLERAYVEPDWTRLPGYQDVTKEQWESAQWQRAHSVKNLTEFKQALGEHLTDELYADIERDQQVRDVVVSGGDMANVPAKRLQEWLFKLMEIEHIRDIRIATKGLMGIPQHFLQDDVLAAYDAIATRARERDKDIAIHTHVNAAQQVTPLVGTAVRKLLDMGYRDVRNQGVLLRGVNTTPNQLLDLCFTLLDYGKILPYYFYMCDMIPNAEHWRLSVAEAQSLQYAILGYLPGFATPRFVCDVPFVGKRWVHMLDDYDRTKGISYWRKNYRTGIEFDDPEALTRRYHYYDPIYTLPEDGQEWWRGEIARGLDELLADLAAQQGITIDA